MAASTKNRPPASRCRANACEAAHLFVLGEQVEDAVEHDEHQAVLAGHIDVGHVAVHDVQRLSAGLGPQLRDHRCRLLDPVHADAGRSEGERDPSGSDGQFQCRPATGQISETGDRVVLVAARRIVVGGGDHKAISMNELRWGTGTARAVQPAMRPR